MKPRAACPRFWRRIPSCRETAPSRCSKPMSDVTVPEAPEIAALLTTYNRAHLLPRVLAGLAAQRLGHDRFEVIVIDDGSTDETQAVLSSWANRLPMRIARQSQSGLAAAKTLGLFITPAPPLVVLDDDDVADPNL